MYALKRLRDEKRKKKKRRRRGLHCDIPKSYRTGDDDPQQKKQTMKRSRSKSRSVLTPQTSVSNEPEEEEGEKEEELVLYIEHKKCPTTNTFKEVFAPRARRNHAVAFVPSFSKLYVHGGYSGGSNFKDGIQYENDFYTFQPYKGLWEKVHPNILQEKPKGHLETAPTLAKHTMIYREYNHKSIIGHQLLIFGGITNFNKPSKTLYIYNLDQQCWQSIKCGEHATSKRDAPMVGKEVPPPTYAHSGVYSPSRDILFVFGGVSTLDLENHAFSNDLYALHCKGPHHFEWQYVKSTIIQNSSGDDKSIPTMVPTRAEHTAVLTTFSMPVLKNIKPSKDEKKKIEEPTFEMMRKEVIVVFGGISYDMKLYDDLWLFDIDTSQWQCLQTTGSKPSPRYQHAALADGHFMYIYGGFSGSFSNSLYRLNLSTNIWEHFQDNRPVYVPPPVPRFGHVLFQKFPLKNNSPTPVSPPGLFYTHIHYQYEVDSSNPEVFPTLLLYGGSNSTFDLSEEKLMYHQDICELALYSSK